MVGFLAGAAPDLDFVVALAGPVAYLEQHRGITHSLLLLPAWALLLAVAFSLLRRRRYSWRAYYGVCCLAIGIHIVGDLITSYGTRILAPFSDWSPGLNTTFIIDPYLSAILVVGLLASLRWYPRALATITLIAATALVAYQGNQYREALDVARGHVAAAELDAERVEAYPQPFSVWNWKLAITAGERHHLATVNLRRHSPPAQVPEDAPWWRRILASYRPADRPQWQVLRQFGRGHEDVLARDVWSNERFAFFRRFAHLPAVREVVDHDEHGTCVWFQDLRFRLEGLTSPFIYGMCRRPVDTDWTLHVLERGGPRAL